MLHALIEEELEHVAKEFPYAALVELLEAIQELEVGVVGDTFPVKFEVVGVLRFIDELAKEQVDEFVESVLPAGNGLRRKAA